MHPKLCNATIRKEVCQNEKGCRFYHAKIYRSKSISKDQKGEDENLEKEKLEKEIRQKVEKELKDKAEKDKKGDGKKDKKKEQEQVFQNPPMAPDIMSILKSLQEQVAELAAAEKVRKQQEQFHYQGWYPVQFQNHQQQ